MKRGQAWGFDLMIAAAIFISGIIFFYFYAINYSGDNSIKAKELNYEAAVIADTLLSEGYPEDWTEENVIEIGILEDNKISSEKVYQFNNLAMNDYDQTKRLLNTKYNYYIRFPENVTFNFTDIDFIGEQEDSENVLKISRTTILNNKIQSIDIIVWE